MQLIETIEDNEYTINVYDNGTREKFLTSNPLTIVQPTILTEDQEIMYQAATNSEMILSLAEIGGI